MQKLYVLLGGLLFLAACTKDTQEIKVVHYEDEAFATISETLDLPAEPYDYSLALPLHLSGGAPPTSVSDDVATLGRVLFYDTELSRNRSVSCASCHHQDRGFADDRALSEGFDGEETRRNSLALGATVSFRDTYGGGSSAFIGGGGALFFWDERAHSIAEQSALTIADDIEMGMDMQELTHRLEGTDYYPYLFRKAFGSEFIEPDRITQALEVFLNSVGAFNTKFDSGMGQTNNQHVDFPNFSARENMGKMLYLNNCASCHGERLASTNLNVANNGLDMEYADKGVGERSSLVSDYGVFKVPQLRNIALTGPYMHDGRFETLEEVVDFYSDNIQNHANLHEFLKEGDEAKRFNFTSEEKAALVDFLHTLTDDAMATDVRFSDPFK